MLKSEGCALGDVLSGQPSVLTALTRQAISRCLRGEGCRALHTKSPKSPIASWAPPPQPAQGPDPCSPAWETVHTSFTLQRLLRLCGELGLSWAEVKLTPVCGNICVVILCFRFILSLNQLDCHHFIAINETKSSSLKSLLLPLIEMSSCSTIT